MFKEVINDEMNFYKQYNSKKTLYGFLGLFSSESCFFDTIEQLENFMKNNDTTFGLACKIDFLGNVLGQKEVIRRTLINGNTKLYVFINDNVYRIYNYENSNYLKKAIWNYEFGNLKSMYEPFKNKKKKLSKNYNN